MSKRRRTAVTLKGVPRLEFTESALILAANLVAEAAIPREAVEDALHVAVSAAHGMDYLLTFHRRPIEFAKSLVGREQLLAQVTPYSESAALVTFPLLGIDDVVAQIRSACSWR